MRRLMLVILALTLSSCGWNAWRGANISTKDYTPEQRTALAASPDPLVNRVADRGAFADVGNRTVYVDTNCDDDSYCIQSLGDDEFWLNHEYGHIVYVLVGQWLGSTNVNQEQGANCIAEVLTSRPPPFTQEGGYWNCPDNQVIFARALMIWFHIIEPTEFPIP